MNAKARSVIISPMPYGKNGKLYCPICDIPVTPIKAGGYFCSKCECTYAGQKEHDTKITKLLKRLR